MSNKNETAAANGKAQDDLLARLEALERRAAEAEAEAQKLREENDRIMSTGGLRYSANDQPFVGHDGGYEFLVTPLVENNPDAAHLKPVKVRCCDEAEALRWYCQAHEAKPGSRLAVDPMKVKLKVEIVGRERADSIMRQKQLSVLRKKVESGVNLTESEQAMVAQYEEEIYGFRSAL